MEEAALGFNRQTSMPEEKTRPGGISETRWGVVLRVVGTRGTGGWVSWR